MQKQLNTQPKPLNLGTVSFLSILSLLFFSFSANGQERNNLKTELFQLTDKMYDKAINADANLLAPEAYEKGVEHYKEAEEDFKKEDDLKEIREGLQQANNYFRKAINHVGLTGTNRDNVA